jgi:alpha-tubulin suppressor-like RCC1 family protein
MKELVNKIVLFNNIIDELDKIEENIFFELQQEDEELDETSKKFLKSALENRLVSLKSEIKSLFSASNFKSITIGKNHSLLLDKEGKLHVLTGETMKQISFDKKISKVSVGDNHTLILTDEGKVYAIGSNRSGQLGLGCFDEVTTFVHVPIKHNQKEYQIADIFAKKNYSAATTVEGLIFTWGMNHSKSLQVASRVPVLIKMRKSTNLIDIS